MKSCKSLLYSSLISPVSDKRSCIGGEVIPNPLSQLSNQSLDSNEVIKRFVIDRGLGMKWNLFTFLAGLTMKEKKLRENWKYVHPGEEETEL